jgi:glycosyltransferase involved in cell wall biosynthesis
VEAENSSELAMRIDRLLQDAPLRRQMGEAARRRAVEFYSADQMVDRLQSLCERLRQEQ